LSSILKALKKLEREGFEKQSEKAWPDSLQSLKEKGRKIRFKKNAMFIVCLILVLSIFSGGLIFYSLRNSTSLQQPPIQAKQHRIEMSQNQEGKTGQIQFPHLDQQVLMSNMRSTTGKIPEIERKPITQKDFFSTDTHTFIKPETMISRKVETTPTHAGSEKDDTALLPMLKDDPRIDLQAIAWSADSKSSFAVINNRIVREGQTCDGIVLIKIDKDEVYFRDGRNEWREKFRIK
jgi:hypothetical protein